MSAPQVTIVTGRRRRPGPASRRRRARLARTARAARRHRVPAARRRRRARPRGPPATGPTLPGRCGSRKDAGEPLGLEVSSAVFDRVRTCDNHCAFCFIYQLPKGMRRSLYLKDDDYRLSFLYGNFTTLTRFTELDAERVLDERLGPLFVSIHATDPEVRAAMLRNPKGATSLRWLRILLDGGIEVHGQVVVCPGVNDGAVSRTPWPASSTSTPSWPRSGVVPLGLSRLLQRARDAAPHRRRGAGGLRHRRPRGRRSSRSVLGRRLVFAADEYYLLAGRDVPAGRRPTTASPSTRTASAWSGPSSGPSTATPAAPGGCATGSSPGSTGPRPRATGPAALARRRAGARAGGPTDR